MHVVAADADAVEARHPAGAVAEDVAHDAHAGPRRVDVGVAHHELLQDVVLDGALQLFRRHALLFRRHDVEGHDGQHGTVHGHAHAHLVQRDAVEEDLHVLHAADGHTGLAHIALHPGVVAVVAPVGGQVEGDAEAHLPGGQVAAVEGVALLCGAEARVLADGPRPHGVHAGVGPAQVGRCPGPEAQVLEVRCIHGRVERLKGKLLPVGDVRVHLAATRRSGFVPVGGQRPHERIAELLHGPRAAQGIGHAGQEALLAQQVVDVTRHPPGEGITFGQRGNWNGKPIAAGGDRAHGLQGGTDQVVVGRGDLRGVADLGLQVDVVGAGMIWVMLGHDACPDLPHGPQACGFKEEVIAEGQCELDPCRRLVDREAGVQHALQDLPTLFQHAACRFQGRVIRTQVEQPDEGVGLDALQEARQIGVRIQSGAQVQSAVRHPLPTALLEQPIQGGGIAAPDLQIDAREQYILQRFRKPFAIAVHDRTVHPAHEVLQQAVVGVGVGRVHLHAHAPDVPAPLHSPPHAWPVLPEGEGAHHGAVRQGNGDGGGVLPLELLLDQLFPGFGIQRREVGKEVLGRHHRRRSGFRAVRPAPGRKMTFVRW